MKIRWKLIHPNRSYDPQPGRIIKDWECKIKDFTISIHKDSFILNEKGTRYSIFINRKTENNDIEKNRLIIALYDVDIKEDKKVKKYAITFLKKWLEEGLQQLERIEK